MGVQKIYIIYLEETDLHIKLDIKNIPNIFLL